MKITKIYGAEQGGVETFSIYLETGRGQLLKIIDDGDDIRILDRHGNKLLIEPISKNEILIREGGLS